MKPKIRNAISWLIVIGCAGFIAHFFIARREQVDLLARISPADVAYLVLLHFVYLAVHGYRYQAVLQKCSGRLVAFVAWFRIYVIGQFLNLAIPQFGNVYRGLRLKADFGISYTNYASSLLSIAWLGTWCNLLTGVIIIGWLSPELRIAAVPALWVLLALTIGCGFGPILIYWVLGRRLVARASEPVSRLCAKISEVVGDAVKALRDGRYACIILILSTVQFALACMIFFACFQALGVAVGAGELVLFYVLLQLFSYVSITPGNLGVQEIAFGLLAEAIHIGMGEGMLVSALLRVTGYVALLVLALPMGGLDLLRHGERNRS